MIFLGNHPFFHSVRRMVVDSLVGVLFRGFGSWALYRVPLAFGCCCFGFFSHCRRQRIDGKMRPGQHGSIRGGAFRARYGILRMMLPSQSFGILEPYY